MSPAYWWSRPLCWIRGHVLAIEQRYVQMLDFSPQHEFVGRACLRCGLVVEVRRLPWTDKSLRHVLDLLRKWM